MTKTPNPFLVVALLVSIFVHLFVVDRMVDLTLRWRLFSTSQGDELFQVRDVNVHHTPRMPVGKPRWRLEELLSLGPPGETIVERENEDKTVLLKSEKFISTAEAEEKLLEAIESAIETEEVAKPGETQESPSGEETIAQEVFAVDEALIKERIPASRPRISSSVKRGTASADLIIFTPSGPSTAAQPTAIAAGPPGQDTSSGKGTERREMAKVAMADLARTIPGVIAPPPTTVESEIESADLVDIVTEDYEKIRKYPPLDDLLTVRLFTYHRVGERKGYFQLLVEPKRDRRDFTIIPKDIIFVVDSSKSITQKKLDYYIEGLKLCLRALGPQDRFNVVEFKKFTRKLAEQDVVPATPETIARAEAFLSELVSVGETDVYTSLTQLVTVKPMPGRPRMILLVSDGRPTTGITKNREIINRLTRLNNLNASIFTFAGGERINTSLLDLLSYRNKGARRFETNDKRIAQSLFSFYQEFSSPILLNPRFNFGSFGSTEVYPKILPDLSLHSRLDIFGRFESEGEFSMQLLGEADGRTKEYVLQQELTGKDNGDEGVAKGWAFLKIYDLVGEIVQQGESEGILSQVRKLSADYGVQTSYYR